LEIFDDEKGGGGSLKIRTVISEKKKSPQPRMRHSVKNGKGRCRPLRRGGTRRCKGDNRKAAKRNGTAGIAGADSRERIQLWETLDNSKKKTKTKAGVAQTRGKNPCQKVRRTKLGGF